MMHILKSLAMTRMSSVARIICLAIFVDHTFGIYIQDPYPSTTDIIAEGLAACPNINFCKENRSLIYNQTCCERCSCSPDCAAKANCCPDMGDLLQPQPSQTSVSGSVPCLTTSLNNLHLTPKSDFGYNMITSCLDGSPCPKRTSGYKKLRENAVVHSEPDKRIFINRKCALCNKAENIVE